MFEYGGAGTQTYTTYAGSGLGLLTGATASPGDAWTLAAGGTGEEEDTTDALAGFKAKGLLVAVGGVCAVQPVYHLGRFPLVPGAARGGEARALGRAGVTGRLRRRRARRVPPLLTT